MQGKNKTGKADVVLSLIQKLYGIESKLNDKTPTQKHEIRQEQAKPIIDKLHKWLEQNQPRLVGKTKLAEAATYLANQWHKLIVYLENGQLNIDNNRAECAIKPVGLLPVWLIIWMAIRAIYRLMVIKRMHKRNQHSLVAGPMHVVNL